MFAYYDLSRCTEGEIETFCATGGCPVSVVPFAVDPIPEHGGVTSEVLALEMLLDTQGVDGLEKRSL